ncbi:MAG: carbohydrate kinase family protein [bacterium]|nr:carbohydrate kinase family protein [bacterium]
MSIVLTGSLAFDHIMVFRDEFRNHILPEKVRMLNVAFNVDSLRREFGGTAGNIAYNLSLLGLRPTIVATVGHDFESYLKRIQEWGMETDCLLQLRDEHTAQAFIMTDVKDNQITAFHPGAMGRAHEQSLSVVSSEPNLVMISPDDPKAMVSHVKYCQAQGWHFWFDPGQAMNALSGDELTACIRGADGLVLNDYEWEMFQQKTGLNLEMILGVLPYVLVTKGHKGVEILSQEGVENVSAVSELNVLDPTGAGDAFRAGLLYGLQNGLGIIESCRYGCAVASFAVEEKGTQNHRFRIDDVEERMVTSMS